jgi:hypothetical protein
MANRRRIQKNRGKKVCLTCGKPIPNPDTAAAKVTCDECLAKVKHYGNRTRATRRLAGLCPHCGKPKNVSNRKNCLECLMKAKVPYNSRKARGICVKCGVNPNRPGKSTCIVCAPKEKQRLREWRDGLIVDAMNAYGGCFCRCCGMTEFEFLTLDHVDGGGNQHRKELRKRKTTDIYTWAKKNGYPPGFQVLCMNCNWARGKFGECPHQSRREAFTFVG